MLLEPIPALSAMLMAVRNLPLNEPNLCQSIARLDARVRGTKSSEQDQWPGIYTDALQLMDQLLAYRAQQAQRTDASARDPHEGVRQAASMLQDVVSRAVNDWPARLSTQENEIIDKANRAIDTLAVTSAPDPHTGETRFTIETSALKSFWDWLQEAEAAWARNNEKLVVARCLEQAELLAPSLPRDPALELGKAPLPLPRWTEPKLAGVSAPTPGVMDAFSRTYKAAVGGFGSISMLGFLLTRVAGEGTLKQMTATVLPWFFGLGLVVMSVVAVTTVPKQQRQAKARTLKRATEQVQRELLAAVKERVRTSREAQFNGLKKYLSREAARLKALSLPSPSTTALKPTVASLDPKTVERMNTEWRQAIEEHLRELQQPPA